MDIDDSAADYCRQIEAYLCRKNDGHLVRIVGPAFEQVCAWAARGVPLKVACRGIDRYFERYYAKGPRRRPVRVEFCEADVLDVFDEWRRAVGAAPVAGETRAAVTAATTLPAHLERAVARLTSMRAGSDRRFDDLLDAAVREVDAMRSAARNARGDARERLLTRLRGMDTELAAAVRGRCDAGVIEQLAADADEELRTYRERMPPDVYRQSHAACVDRLLRERLRLPRLTFE